MKELAAPSTDPVPSADWRGTVRVGLFVVIFTFVGLGGWSAVAGLSSGVLASGSIQSAGSRKTIQHLEGGIVREIFARDGMKVKQGDLLVRLDPTRAEATDLANRQQLAIALSMEARLLAQRDMKDEVVFPPEVTSLRNDPLISTSIMDNSRQFESRKRSLQSAIDVLEAQRSQALKEIEQAGVQEQTAKNQIGSINTELPALKDLMKRGLVPLPRVTALERQMMQTQGQLEAAQIARGEAGNKVEEVAAKIDQLKQDYRQEAATMMSDVRATLGELQQKVVITSDAVKRGEIRAPVDGTVQEMKVFTVGGVVRAGDPILDIAPLSDDLVVRVRVSPLDIDRVEDGARVEIRLPQFVKFQSQVIEGNVTAISRDSITDPQQPQLGPYFAVEVAVDGGSVPEDIAGRLSAGMTTQVIIRTGDRTMLSYLVAPLMNRINTAMRER
ncbi:HlyD family type I secretion periplasmic adaptor subunit [Terrihabitans rhizophilus]|uniref:Membrane fusion protein (MFP) family protein n=1 Tax=Terrihabitans rhizophilus TaxID=3092662 RepID=A0ABU4RLR6_9HYPH|nr:HlyD family type I secretion periplasmic adaptor subunit [Terrihabitans sp. PJ23]MDX6805769.1 HlyD family type I secretion periplasmic adaptor subunit [Terrihabitans sp. PJ23]